MTSTFKRILSLLAAASLLGLTFTSAMAQDEAPTGEEAAPAETAPAEGADAAKLSEEQLDYVAVSSVVACYNKRVSETDKAKAAIESFLETEGLTLDEYQAMEKKFRGDTGVQEAIKAEMDLCDTKVLAMPEEDDGPAEELTEEEKKALEEAEKKNEWTYRKKVYKGTVSSGGVSKGRIMIAFTKDGKTAKGNLTGSLQGSGFAVGFKGVRKDNKVTLKGGSGKKNTANVSVTFKKETDKEGFVHYSSASGKFTGKINGRDVSFSFTAASKKK